jgi:hypothetical protein
VGGRRTRRGAGSPGGVAWASLTPERALSATLGVAGRTTALAETTNSAAPIRIIAIT